MKLIDRLLGKKVTQVISVPKESAIDKFYRGLNQSTLESKQNGSPGRALADAAIKKKKEGKPPINVPVSEQRALDAQANLETENQEILASEQKKKVRHGILSVGFLQRMRQEHPKADEAELNYWIKKFIDENGGDEA